MRIRAGIDTFAAATRLNVHHKLTSKELSPDWVIKCNSPSDHTWLTDQHGLRVVARKRLAVKTKIARYYRAILRLTTTCIVGK